MPSLIYNYGDWDFWAPYDPANGTFGAQKVTIDGENKLILINADITELNFRDDVYSKWKEWTLARDNIKFETALSLLGGDPLPGDRSLGTTFFLENGWRMRTWEGNHALTVTGNFFTREGLPAFVPTLNPWTITVNLNTSTLVETIYAEGAADGSSITVEDIEAIAVAVRSEMDTNSQAFIQINAKLIDIETMIANIDDNTVDLLPILADLEIVKKKIDETQAFVLSN